MDFARIDDVYGTGGVPRPQLVVPLAQGIEVFRFDDMLSFSVSSGNSAANDFGRRVEKDDEVGGFNRPLKESAESVVQVHLVTVQGFFGEDAVFFPEVIADDQIGKEIELLQVHLLREPAGQVEHLGREGKAIGVGVK